MHPHGTWGVVGAALSTAKLKDLNLQQTYQAVSIASNYSLNTLFDTALEGSTVRDSYCGVANYLGILSAGLAQNGFTGLNNAISRHYAELGQNEFKESCMTDALGERFEISRNYFKLHAACRYTHSALDALNKIVAKHGDIELNDIDKIEVYTYNLAAGLNNQIPRNALQAKFSIPYAIAARLFYGNSFVEAFTTDAITKDVVKFSKMVFVFEKPQFSSQLPEKRPTQVTIFFKNGGKQSCLVDIPEGEDTKPYSVQQLIEKFQSLICPILGDRRANKVLKRVMDLENVKNVRKLTNIFI
jgi:2-methylcitrate dehydratase PrpD